MSERVLVYTSDPRSTRAGAHCESRQDCGGKDSIIGFTYDGRTVHIYGPQGSSKPCETIPRDCPMQQNGRQFVDMSQPRVVALLAGTAAHYAMVSATEQWSDAVGSTDRTVESGQPEQVYVAPDQAVIDEDIRDKRYL